MEFLRRSGMFNLSLWRPLTQCLGSFFASGHGSDDLLWNWGNVSFDTSKQTYLEMRYSIGPFIWRFFYIYYF